MVEKRIKKTPNAFLLYLIDYRNGLFGEKPEGNVNSDISKEISEKWKELDDNLRKFYNDKAKSMREDLKRKNPGYCERRKRKKRTIDVLVHNITNILQINDINDLLKDPNHKRDS